MARPRKYSIQEWYNGSISPQRRQHKARQILGLCPNCGRLPDKKEDGTRYFRCKKCRERA